MKQQNNILTKIEERLVNLSDRINGNPEKGILGINPWIESNPTITDPNAYEIMSCQIEYAELLAELKQYYDETGYPKIILEGRTHKTTHCDLPRLHPIIGDCMFGLIKMEKLRNIEKHPFFNMDEPGALYFEIKVSQISCDYELADSQEMRSIKKELLCKLISVPFYIWQEKRTDPNYKYDNEQEFKQLLDMAALLETTQKSCQYKEQIDALLSKIRTDYKYASSSEVKKTYNKNN